MSTLAARSGAWHIVRGSWERSTVYLPIILMGVMALGTYWLARNTPASGPTPQQKAARHDPDSYMRGFAVKTFDAQGRLKSEVFGTEARHYPDTDTFEIEQPKIRSFNAAGELTVATAKKAISNADGSEVQLLGDAVVTRDATVGKDGREKPRLVFRGEFLDVFMETEKVRSNKPVELTRGDDKFTAERMDYDNIEQVLQLTGRVRGTIAPKETQ